MVKIEFNHKRSSYLFNIMYISLEDNDVDKKLFSTQVFISEDMKYKILIEHINSQSPP